MTGTFFGDMGSRSSNVSFLQASLEEKKLTEGGLGFPSSSVTQSCPSLCDPVDPMPGFPLHYQLVELTQTHVHPVGDSIQPAHPLSSPAETSSAKWGERWVRKIIRKCIGRIVREM